MPIGSPTVVSPPCHRTLDVDRLPHHFDRTLWRSAGSAAVVSGNALSPVAGKHEGLRAFQRQKSDRRHSRRLVDGQMLTAVPSRCPGVNSVGNVTHPLTTAMDRNGSAPVIR